MHAQTRGIEKYHGIGINVIMYFLNVNLFHDLKAYLGVESKGQYSVTAVKKCILFVYLN
jgi:hypothetical protein